MYTLSLYTDTQTHGGLTLLLEGLHVSIVLALGEYGSTLHHRQPQLSLRHEQGVVAEEGSVDE